MSDIGSLTINSPNGEIRATLDENGVWQSEKGWLTKYLNSFFNPNEDSVALGPFGRGALHRAALELDGKAVFSKEYEEESKKFKGCLQEE